MAYWLIKSEPFKYSWDQFVKDKKRRTFKKHFGVENCFQSEEIKEKIKQTCKEKYGVDYSSKIDYVRYLNREKLIQRRLQQKLSGDDCFPCIGMNERDCLDRLESIIKYSILRNEKRFGYFPDGTIDELFSQIRNIVSPTNTAVEVALDNWHNVS